MAMRDVTAQMHIVNMLLLAACDMQLFFIHLSFLLFPDVCKSKVSLAFFLLFLLYTGFRLNLAPDAFNGVKGAQRDKLEVLEGFHGLQLRFKVLLAIR